MVNSGARSVRGSAVARAPEEAGLTNSPSLVQAAWAPTVVGRLCVGWPIVCPRMSRPRFGPQGSP
eukprot:964970-Pyramimonas_sp.AAC.1